MKIGITQIVIKTKNPGEKYADYSDLYKTLLYSLSHGFLIMFYLIQVIIP
jgi:hypothetical protein